MGTNPFSFHDSKVNIQNEEMVVPHLLAAFDIFDDIENAMKLNEYGDGTSQIESQHFEQLNSRDAINNVTSRHESHSTKSSSGKSKTNRKRRNRQETFERRVSSSTKTVDDLCKSDDTLRILCAQKYLEKEGANEKKLISEMKQISLQRKKKKDLLKQLKHEEEEHDEKYQYVQKSLLSHLFLSSKEPTNLDYSISLDDEELVGFVHKTSESKYDRMLSSSNEIYSKYANQSNDTCT